VDALATGRARRRQEIERAIAKAAAAARPPMMAVCSALRSTDFFLFRFRDARDFVVLV
jgi:hypothetical protein